MATLNDLSKIWSSNISNRSWMQFYPNYWTHFLTLFIADNFWNVNPKWPYLDFFTGFGDYLQQKYERRKWNPWRSFHMSSTYGLTSGFLCHFWYNALDKVVPGVGLKVVLRKIALDQILFSPICIVACVLAAQSFNNQHIFQSFTKDALIMDKSVDLYVADWLLWPPAQFINFHFLPTKYRVLFDNLVSLVFDCYSSKVQHNSH